MSFFKPNIKWIPKEINGSTEIMVKEKSPIRIEKSSYAGVKPEDETPTSGETNIRDNFSPEDQEIMDNYIELSNDIRNDLDFIDTEIEKRLEGVSFPYDPAKQVLLEQAHHCKYCGNPTAPNVLTYDDFKNNEENKNALNMQVMGGSFSTADIGNISPTETIAQQEQYIDNMNVNTLDMVWRQIMIWVLEFIYQLVKPLEGVPFGVDQVPKGIKRAIENLQKNQKVNTALDNARKYVEEEMKKPEDERNQEAIEAYYKGRSLKDTVSLADVYKVGSLAYNMFCSEHVQDFDKYSHPIIQGSSFEIWMWAKKNNDLQKQSLSAMDEYAGTIIADGYETIPGLKFTNKKPEQYLKARKDGQGPGAAFLTGGLDVMNDVKKRYIRNTKNILKSWWESPETLCCILRNVFNVGKISVSTEFGNGRNVLLVFRGILQLLRDTISWEINQDFADLFNLIINLVNSILSKILSALTTLLRSKMLGWIGNSDFFEALKTSNGVKCLPWTEMVTEIADSVKLLFDELFNYINSFWKNLKLFNVKSMKITERTEFALKVDKWIYIIDSVLKYMKVWELCSDNPEISSSDISGEYTASQDSDFKLPDDNFKKILQNLNETPTIYSDRGIEGIQASRPGQNLVDKIKKAQTEENKRKDEDIDRVSKPWNVDEPGIRILLTNFMGLSEEDVEKVIGENAENCCENVMSDKDLLKIRDSLLSQK